jgi:glutamyl-tRNA reductase
VVISTCNRFEAYVVAAEPATAADRLLAYIAGRGRLDGAAAAEQIYVKRGVDALRHLFRVASSLDSMVVGEPQILGQVKEAYTRASEYRTNGKIIDKAFHAAFRAAKRVRTETAIAENPVSISHVAVDLATSIFSSLRDRRVLVVGAGKMGELAAKRFVKVGGMRLTVTNRTASKAEEMAARLGAVAAPFGQLEQLLVENDVVISSTAAKQHVITAKLAADVIRKRHYRPLFLIDIAVPRDIEPSAGQVENVYLYDVDDLQKVADENLGARANELARCEAIVGEELVAHQKKAQEVEIAPLIVALRQKLQAIAAAELERAGAGLSPEDAKGREALKALAHGIVNKVLHRPTVTLKEEYAGGGAGPELADAAAKLFGIDDAGKAGGGAAGADTDAQTQEQP